MRDDEDDLLARFNKRLGGIDTEIPSPRGTPFRGAGSMQKVGRRRNAAPGWIGAALVAVALVAVAVLGVRVWLPPGPTPSLPAVGHTSEPSPTTQPSFATDGTFTPPTFPPDPTATPSAIPTATTTATSSGSPTPTPTPHVPDIREWADPERIDAANYDEVNLVVDPNGSAHVAAVAADGIYYLTNATGSWTREAVTSALPDGYDGQPAIVLESDGTLAIAFARFGGLQCSFGCNPVDPQGIFLITNRSGSWSDAVSIIEGRVQEPSLIAVGDRLHLAYSRGDEGRTVEYAANDETYSWATQVLGEGRAPSLRMGGDGLARIAYDGAGTINYAVQRESGEFTIEAVPGEWVASTPLLALSATDEPRVVFFNDIDQGEPSCGALVVRRTGGSWGEAAAVFPNDELCQVRAEIVDTDAAGTLHVISWYDVSGPGVWYANDAGGTLHGLQLREPANTIDDRPGGGSGLALDRFGRPHVIYDVYEFDSDGSEPNHDGLWYVLGPLWADPL